MESSTSTSTGTALESSPESTSETGCESTPEARRKATAETRGEAAPESRAESASGAHEAAPEPTAETEAARAVPVPGVPVFSDLEDGAEPVETVEHFWHVSWSRVEAGTR